MDASLESISDPLSPKKQRQYAHVSAGRKTRRQNLEDWLSPGGYVGWGGGGACHADRCSECEEEKRDREMGEVFCRARNEKQVAVQAVSPRGDAEF